MWCWSNSHRCRPRQCSAPTAPARSPLPSSFRAAAPSRSPLIHRYRPCYHRAPPLTLTIATTATTPGTEDYFALYDEASAEIPARGSSFDRCSDCADLRGGHRSESCPRERCEQARSAPARSGRPPRDRQPHRHCRTPTIAFQRARDQLSAGGTGCTTLRWQQVSHGPHCPREPSSCRPSRPGGLISAR